MTITSLSKLRYVGLLDKTLIDKWPCCKRDLNTLTDLVALDVAMVSHGFNQHSKTCVASWVPPWVAVWANAITQQASKTTEFASVAKVMN